jgi:hypothetical protein
MVKQALPGNAGKCVVALALDAVFGKKYPLQVGKTFTKIWDVNEKIEVRFMTPAALSKRLGTFDEKKGWQLPSNIYKLHPIPAFVRNGEKNRASARDYHAKKGKRKAAATVKIGGKTTIIKGAKRKSVARKPASRIVLRNTRIKWAPPTL